MSSVIRKFKSKLQQAITTPPTTDSDIRGLPYFSEILLSAGVVAYEWTLPSRQCIYETKSGPIITLEKPLINAIAEIPRFKKSLIIQIMKQEQRSGLSLPEFQTSIWKAGVIRYVVDLYAREIIFYGHSGASHAIPYPKINFY